MTAFFTRAIDAITGRCEPRDVDFLGYRLSIRDGILRDPPDYDEAWFYACAQRASVIFDVGSNQGQAALIALRCPNVREVVLVEANPRALEVAAETLVRNHLSGRARFVCAFASDRAKAMARLWTVSEGAAGSMYSGHAKTAARAGTSIEVPTVTLDDLVATLGVVPDLIKIDVEGAELLVLAGARACAAPNRAIFLVEMHSNPELTMEANLAGALRWSAETGYDVWYMAKHTKLESAEQFKTRGRCHLLMVPSGQSYPEYLRGIKQGSPLSAATPK